MPNRPVPTNIRRLRGNPGKRPYNDAEPPVRAGKPRIPDHVKADAEAAREWKRITETLHEMGLLSTADRSALAAYCLTWSRWVDAETKLRQFGVIIKGANDVPMQSPYLAIARDAVTQIRQLLVEFGLTPSSRSRIHQERSTKSMTLSEFEQWEQRA